MSDPTARGIAELPRTRALSFTAVQGATVRGRSSLRTVALHAKGIVQTMRPRQWVKNLFVLAPVVFAKELNQRRPLLAGLAAVVVFCTLAGAVYTMNDLVDAPLDRLHATKRLRPIASGQVPRATALLAIGVLLVAALGGAAVLSWPFTVAAAAYFWQNVAYSLRLKRVAYVDVVCIALGFVLRIVAGGLATGTHVSGWMITCTALLALFLGFGKRRHELSIAGARSIEQRPSLKAYTPNGLTITLAVTGLATVIGYFAYALDPDTRRSFSPLLWMTTVHTLFGVLRFVQLTIDPSHAEPPTDEMLRDVPFLANLMLWAIEIVAIVYGAHPLGVPATFR